jgi:hypothetical protein
MLCWGEPLEPVEKQFLMLRYALSKVEGLSMNGKSSTI